MCGIGAGHGVGDGSVRAGRAVRMASRPTAWLVRASGSASNALSAPLGTARSELCVAYGRRAARVKRRVSPAQPMSALERIGRARRPVQSGSAPAGPASSVVGGTTRVTTDERGSPDRCESAVPSPIGAPDVTNDEGARLQDPSKGLPSPVVTNDVTDARDPAGMRLEPAPTSHRTSESAIAKLTPAIRGPAVSPCVERSRRFGRDRSAGGMLVHGADPRGTGELAGHALVGFGVSTVGVALISGRIGGPEPASRLRSEPRSGG